TSHIQPDGLFDRLVQNNWQPLTMVSFGDEMHEMPCAVDVGYAQWGYFSSSTTCVAQDEKQSDIPVKQCTALRLRVSSIGSVTLRNVLPPSGVCSLEQLDKLLVWKSRNFRAFPSDGMHAERPMPRACTPL